MTIALKNLSKWLFVPEGQGVSFDRGGGRRIRIEARAPEMVNLTLIGDDGVPIFLGEVGGTPEVIDFVPDPGHFEIIADGDCYIYSSEFEETSVAIIDPIIFTKIAPRRTRNPELELMAHTMMQNIDKRMAKATAEMDRISAQNQALSEALANVNARQNPATDDLASGGKSSGGDDTGVPVAEAKPAPAAADPGE